jgi:hypothetical protein
MITDHHQFSIDDVPSEILISIFEFLDVKLLVHTMGLVNKQWRSAVANPCVWKNRFIPKLNETIVESDVTPFVQCFKEWGIRNFSICDNSQINLWIPLLSEFVTKLNVYSSEVSNDINCGEAEFPELTDFSCYNRAKQIEGWITMMPNLTALKYNWSVTTVLSKKLLRKLELLNTITEHETIQLFQELPLLEDVTLKFNLSEITSSMWKSVFDIDGVSNRLTRLNIGTTKERNYVNPSTHLHMTKSNVLRDLCISGDEMSIHSNLLYSCQQTLELLYCNGITNTDGIQYSLLRKLTLRNARNSDILSILASCNNTIEQIEFSEPIPDGYTVPEYLSFPNIKVIVINGKDISELSRVILKDIDGKFLRNLSILNANQLSPVESDFLNISSRWKNMTSLAIPDSILPYYSKSTLKSITRLSISGSDIEFDETLFEIILNCSSLSSFVAKYSIITVNDWIARLLVKRGADMKQISFQGKLKSGPVVFTDIPICNFLRSFAVDYSSIQQNIEIILKNSPNLLMFHCCNIPLSGYSNFLETVNKYPVKFFRISIDASIDNRLTHCFYLDNLKTSRIWFGVEDTTYLTLRDYLLAVICLVSEAENRYLLTGTGLLNRKSFFEDYNDELISMSMVKEKQLEIIGQVVGMIQNISDQKKEAILDALKESNNNLMNVICEKVTQML